MAKKVTGSRFAIEFFAEASRDRWPSPAVRVRGCLATTANGKLRSASKIVGPAANRGRDIFCHRLSELPPCPNIHRPRPLRRDPTLVRGPTLQPAARKTSPRLGLSPLTRHERASRLPANRLPANRLPANRLPANRLPANRLPASRLPASRPRTNRHPISLSRISRFQTSLTRISRTRISRTRISRTQISRTRISRTQTSRTATSRILNQRILIRLRSFPCRPRRKFNGRRS